MVGPTSVGLQLGRFQRGKLPTCVSQTDCREAERLSFRGILVLYFLKWAHPLTVQSAVIPALS